MSELTILNRNDDYVSYCMGVALLQVRLERDMSLPEMGRKLKRTRQQVAAYIAGSAEMPAILWMRAKEMWPDLEAKFHEQLKINGGGK